MIRQDELDEAIAICQGEKNPNANTCIKLAAYYTIRNNLYNNTNNIPQYSGSAPQMVDLSSESEFARLVDGRDINEIMPVLDEFVESVRVLLPKLYAGLIRRL